MNVGHRHSQLIRTPVTSLISGLFRMIAIERFGSLAVEENDGGLTESYPVFRSKVLAKIPPKLAAN